MRFLIVPLLIAALAVPALAAPRPPFDDPSDAESPLMLVFPDYAERTLLTPEQFHVSDYAGKVVLVDLWASWCKPCRRSLPWLSAMQDKYHDQDLVVVTVDLDRRPQDAADLLQGLDRRIIVVHDPDGVIPTRLESTAVPSMYVFDRDGNLVSSFTGFGPGAEKERDGALYDILTATPPVPVVPAVPDAATGGE